MYYIDKSCIIETGDTVTYELNGTVRTHTILPYTEIWKPINVAGSCDQPIFRSENTTGANPQEGTISENAPLAQALLGKRIGENFSYTVNERKSSGKVLQIVKANKQRISSEDQILADRQLSSADATGLHVAIGANRCLQIVPNMFFYNVSGNDALLLHKYFGYKIYNKDPIKVGFPVARRDIVLKRLDELGINYNVYNRAGNIVISKRFTHNNYEILETNTKGFESDTLEPSIDEQTKTDVKEAISDKTQTIDKQIDVAKILQALSQGINPYTGQSISGDEIQSILQQILQQLPEKPAGQPSIEKKNNVPSEYQKVLDFNQEFESLLSEDKFLARSDYKYLLEKYNYIYTFFDSTDRAKTLSYYCEQNNVSNVEIAQFLDHYLDISDLSAGSSLIKSHNIEFLDAHLQKDKQYLDDILKEVDSKIKLDDDQRKVVLSDEDYTLIIAGAGAGKTTTVAAKVKYLVDKKNVNPKKILVISFTNKAVGELKGRINTALAIPCPITTFHSAGYAILRKDEERKLIKTEEFLYFCVNEYLKGNILSQPDLVDKLIMFFGSYFDMPYEGDDINLFFNYVVKADFTTLRSSVNDYNEQVVDRRTRKVTTISNEVLRSVEEVKIANFLYLHQIDYKYEEIYPYHILKARKPYTPDFCIRQGNKIAYIEHFGITESGQHSFYSAEELARYKQDIQDKIALHKAHGTTLMYTYSQYNDGRDFLEHLYDQLEANGFVLHERPSDEVFIKLVNAEENKYISKLVKLLCTFINNFKTNGYTLEDFYRFQKSNANVRTKLFLEICKACYLDYQRRLSEENAIDFQDMINESARILREKQVAKEQLDFEYIIVDEYQDISRQRFDLTKELSKLCSAKIIAVGDDWQSIYAFSGSDVTLFTHFCSIMGYGQELKITNTYRNAQEVINIAGNFIQKNESQIKKSLNSPKHIRKPVVIYTYSEEVDRKKFAGRGGKYFLLGKKVEEIIGKILEQNALEGKRTSSSILLIGRFNFDARNLCFSSDFVYDDKNGKISSKKYRNARLEFLTAHSSKGLGYDNVIIINARNDTYGFPSKIDDDPVMKYVIKEDNTIEYAEERRLFYVAMTRTKNRVFIVTPENRPSEFILELIKDYPEITVHGDLNKNVVTNIGVKRCPICGYPLQFRYKPNYGLSLWMCTNEPEVCNFISNNLAGGEMSVQKCDWCKDGYLVVKKDPRGGTLLGCTNYKADGTGCNRTMYYQHWNDANFEVDKTADKIEFQKVAPTSIPKMKPVTPRSISGERKRVDVHKISYVPVHLGAYEFTAIADDEGNLITDIELLDELHKLRYELMQETHQSSVAIITNTGLVNLATYRPETREEFIKLNGLGERTFDLYGLRFIRAIKDFYAKK